MQIYLPIDFKLFDQRWKIRAAQPGEIGDDLGQCRPDHFEILINPNQTDESMQHTIMHEITHAIEQKLDLEMTERQVDIMALGYMHFLRSNPEYIEIILGSSAEAQDEQQD